MRIPGVVVRSMNEFPKDGMRYEQARSRARRFAKSGDTGMVSSLINQARIHEGSKAAKELTREIKKDFGR